MRVLAVDVGTRRIGVAISDPTGTIAQSHSVIARAGWKKVADAIRRIIEGYGVDQVVVGLPLRLDGTEGPAAVEARMFAARLHTELSVPVIMQDERLSTTAAERAMLSQDTRRKRRRERRDAVAAAVFLQTYLDRNRGGERTSPKDHDAGGDP